MNYLPVELLERILSLANLSRDEGLSCRLVCRGFCSIISPKLFGRIRLSKFDREDFDRLVNLSQSQLACLVVDFEYKIIRFISPKDIHDVDSLIQLSHEFDTPSVQDMTSSLVEHHKAHLHQVDILGTFYDIISLSKALPAFTSLKSVAISTFDGPYLGVEPAMTRAFWGVIKALNNCPHQIESFSIDSFWKSNLLVPPSKLAQIHEGLEDLVHLSIGNVYGRRQVDSFQEVLMRIPNLQTLRIGSDGQACYEWQYLLRERSGAGHIYWPHLRILEMNGGLPGRSTIQSEGLIRFLEEHKNTLADLTIKRLVLVNHITSEARPSEWWSVVERLKSFRGLTKLVLRELEEYIVADGTSKLTEEARLLEWENMITKNS